MFAHIKKYHGNHTNFKSLYGFGGRCLKIRDVYMDFEPYFKVHSFVSVHPKNIIPRQMINLNMIFHVEGSVYRLVKIWNSPQFPAEFRNGQLIVSPTLRITFQPKFWNFRNGCKWYETFLGKFSCCPVAPLKFRDSQIEMESAFMWVSVSLLSIISKKHS